MHCSYGLFFFPADFKAKKFVTFNVISVFFFSEVFSKRFFLFFMLNKAVVSVTVFFC